LARANEAPIRNFAQDVSDAKKYITLLSNICPQSPERSQFLEQSYRSNEDRVKAVLKFAEHIHCRQFVTAEDILRGNQRLNLAFTAGLFNKFIGIELPSDQEIRTLYDENEKLKLKCESLQQSLRVKEEKIQDLSNKVEKERIQSLKEKEELEDALNAKYEHFKLCQEAEVDKQKFKFQAFLQKKVEEEERLKSTHEKALIELQNAHQDKLRQELNSVKRQHERKIQHLSQEMIQLKLSLVDFFEKNDVKFEIDASEKTEHLPSHLRSGIMKLMETYYQKCDEVGTFQRQLEHLEHVNEVIGNKITQYAESMIVRKRQEKKSILGAMFQK
jgi:hypothetical protein